MLKKLTLRNFQNHKAIAIPIDPLVTTIVGGTNVGKSAIIRALRWLCFNRPTGDAFIRDGSNKVVVTLEADASTISRSKDQSLNSYKLNDQVFAAFGSGIPEDIESILQVARLNFQNQHDGPFWLCETPGEISRQMNSVVNLSAMDDAMTYIASVVRKSTTTTEIFSGQAEAAKERLESYGYLDALDKRLIGLEETNEELARDTETAAQISEAISETLSAAQRLRNASGGLSAVQIVAQEAVEVRKLALERDGLLELTTAARVQKRLRAVDLSNWTRIGSMWDRLKTAEDVIVKLMSLIDETKAEKRSRSSLTKKTDAARLDLQKQSEGICPLCKQQINQ